PLDTFVGVRDYAMILTLYATGIRASELVGMSTGHLLSDGMLYVRGKGGHDRYVPTGDTLGAALRGYLHARLGLRPGKLSAFWLTHRGVPLRNGRSVW